MADNTFIWDVDPLKGVVEVVSVLVGEYCQDHLELDVGALDVREGIRDILNHKELAKDIILQTIKVKSSTEYIDRVLIDSVERAI